MVNKIIADYLKAGKRIVIPQFGAFLHRDTDGGVVFVSFLRKDDGVLAGQLSATYGLSSEEAYGVIAEYVSQIKKSVTERGCFVVEGVGQLKIDSNGVCYLESDMHTKPVVAPANPAARPVQSAQSGQAATMPGVGGPHVGAASASRPQSQPMRQQPSNISAERQPQEQFVGQQVNRGAGSGAPNSVGAATPRPQNQAMGGSAQVNVTSSPRMTAPQSAQKAQTSSNRSVTPGSGRPVAQGVYGYQQPSQPTRPQQQTQPSYGQPQNRPMQQNVQAQQPQGSSATSGQPYRGAQYGQPQAGGAMPPYMGGGAGVPPRQPSQQPRQPQQPQQRQGTDKFLIVAIAAAIIALGAIIYGVIFASSSAPKIDPMELPVHQRPAVLDSIQKEDSIQAAEMAAKEAAKAQKSKR